MAYVLIENFSGGVDRSRPRYVGPPGSLWSGINGHLSRGGDFEKRKAFVATYSLPPGTASLAKVASGLVVFGSAPAPGGIPPGVIYQRLQHPTDATRTLLVILSWDLYNGFIYAIAQFDNGDIRHFYNAVEVSDWDDGGTKPTGYGSIVKTHKRKVYSPVRSVEWFSELDTPTTFDSTQAGSGFINMSTHQSGSDVVTGQGIFQNYLAVFSRRIVQIWAMADDDAQNAPFQTIPETGTRAPRSVIGFGDVDCFYLSDSGVRSLRTRTGSNTAGVNDVGTPIDSLIREWIDTLEDVTVQNAVAVIEPVDGRFMLAVGSRLFVFTFFPSKKIAAWSWYEPGVVFTDMVALNDRVYCRAGDTVYLYGGADNNTYDPLTMVTAGLPFLSGGKPGTFKVVKGMDIAATGEWDCKLLVDPNDETQFVALGALDGVSFPEEGIPVNAHTTHIAPVLTHRGAGPASLSQIAVHTDGAETNL
jgi:hypothetical protein